jgi:ubiquinol-cytochrome c reductase cytochrome b subunit
LMNLVKGKGTGKAKLIALVGAAVLIGALKVFEAKFWGVAVMGGAVVILAFLPWLDQSPVKSIRYRPGFHKVIYGIFVINFCMLGFLGVKPPSETYNLMAQAGTLVYLGFFVLMPFWSQLGTFKPVPDRVTFKPH